MSETVSPWSKYLSLAVHEFRSPLTVLGGYLRMLLKEQVGPIPPTQRKLLEELRKSSGRLSVLVDEMSALGQLLDGRQSITAGSVDMAALLTGLHAHITDNEHQAPVHVEVIDRSMTVKGDRARLRDTLHSVIHALRREIIDTTELRIRGGSKGEPGRKRTWIAIGTPAVAAALQDASPDLLEPFDVWREGCGLALPLARQVVELHEGRLLALTPEATLRVSGKPWQAVAGDHPPRPRQSGCVMELPII